MSIQERTPGDGHAAPWLDVSSGWAPMLDLPAPLEYGVLEAEAPPAPTGPAAEEPLGTAPGPVLIRVNKSSARRTWPAKEATIPATRRDRGFMLLQLQANAPVRNGFVTGGDEQGRTAIGGDECGVANWSER